MLTTITVDSFLDNFDPANPVTDGVITLREAVVAANTDASAGDAPAGSGADRIVFAGTQSDDKIITLDSDSLGEISIADTESLTIDASALNSLTIDADDLTGTGIRIFNITDPSNGTSPPLVTIVGLTLTGADSGDEGGAIHSKARLLIRDSIIVDNAADQGGGIFVRVAPGDGTPREVLKIENSTIQGNNADNGGGVAVISGTEFTATTDTIEISNTTFTNNHASDNGGGLFAELFGAELTVNKNSKFSLNTADDGNGGGFFAQLTDASVHILDSAFETNLAEFFGGGISLDVRNGSAVEITRSTLSGNTANVFSGGGGGGLYGYIDENATLKVTGSEFTDNHGHEGGGIKVEMRDRDSMGGLHPDANGSVFTMTNSLVELNTAEMDGGGIYAFSGSGGEISVQDSIITGNTAGESADETFDLNELEYAGGGIYAYLFSKATAATMTVAGTEISNNTAGLHGGGIALCTKRQDEFAETSRLSVYNSTISGNTAGHTNANNFGGTGGGVHLAIFPSDNFEGLDAHFQNTTVTENTSDMGGGIFSFNQTDLEFAQSTTNTWLTNTIISGNHQHGITPNTPGDANNFWGSINADDTRYNLFGHETGIKANTFFDHITHAEILFNALGASEGNLDNNGTNDPGLGPLLFNGGFARTHRPDINSPAIDAGSNALAVVPFTTTTPPTALASDQRGDGFERFFDVPNVNYEAPGDGSAPLQTVDIGAYEISLPKVVEVVISASNSGEQQSYFDLVNVRNESNGDQIRALPFTGADTVTIHFSEPVVVMGNELELDSIRTATGYSDEMNEVLYDISTYASSSHTAASWHLDPTNPNNPVFHSPDQILITLKDTIYAENFGTATSAALDGEWINPAGISTLDPSSLIYEFPSGNNMPGGEFRFVFTTTVIGDYDGDGFVRQGDLDVALLNWGGTESILIPVWAILLDSNDFMGQTELDAVLLHWGDNYSILILTGDLDGNGVVDIDDYHASQTYENDMLVIGQWGLWFATNLIPNPPSTN